jgi:hypothetical protein
MVMPVLIKKLRIITKDHLGQLLQFYIIDQVILILTLIIGFDEKLAGWR